MLCLYNFCMILLFHFYLYTCIRLDGQLDMVDSPKPNKLKEVNTSKLDKNMKTESSIDKNLGL